MSPSTPNIPPPVQPPPPPAPVPFGQNQEAGMRAKKSAASNANAFGSFLGTGAAPGSGQTGRKTLLGQ
jgi:hypothetical protein